jgi:DNA polymerase I-like protein with 3'-5' exonuclease and polymerase domains
VELVKWLILDYVPAELVLTVHDSVMFHAEESAQDEVCYNAVRIMESWPSAGVPLIADLKVGKAWGSLEDYQIIRG